MIPIPQQPFTRDADGEPWTQKGLSLLNASRWPPMPVSPISALHVSVAVRPTTAYAVGGGDERAKQWLFDGIHNGPNYVETVGGLGTSLFVYLNRKYLIYKVGLSGYKMWMAMWYKVG